MGWAERARRATERLELHSYAVKRWTAYEWNWPEGNQKSVRELRDKMRTDREGHLERAAAMMTRYLRSKYPVLEPEVKLVKVKGDPQLCFSLVVVAPDNADAQQRAMYKIARALTVRIPTGRTTPRTTHRGAPLQSGAIRAETTTLSPPWGKWEVRVKRPSSRKAAA